MNNQDNNQINVNPVSNNLNQQNGEFSEVNTITNENSSLNLNNNETSEDAKLYDQRLFDINHRADIDGYYFDDLSRDSYRSMTDDEINVNFIIGFDKPNLQAFYAREVRALENKDYKLLKKIDKFNKIIRKNEEYICQYIHDEGELPEINRKELEFYETLYFFPSIVDYEDLSFEEYRNATNNELMSFIDVENQTVDLKRLRIVEMRAVVNKNNVRLERIKEFLNKYEEYKVNVDSYKNANRVVPDDLIKGLKFNGDLIFNAQVIQTGVGNINGHVKCPSCSSADITLQISTGKLVCNACRFVFDPVKEDAFIEDVFSIKGEVFGSAATDIDKNANSVVTLKCENCGCEVVINTEEKTQARCHWCRTMLSANNQINNGVYPDLVLPFNVSKEDAMVLMTEFFKKHSFFANSQFKKEFRVDNISGVYFPYNLVDVNAHANYDGYGEHEVRKYSTTVGDHSEIVRDVELYHVKRDFDIAIKDLSIEASVDKLDKSSWDRTNNVINAIMPFDTENCVKYDSNYLKGYTSEKRDLNIETVVGQIDLQTQDVIHYAAAETASNLERGIRWDVMDKKVYGHQWKTAYLPVWLLSFQDGYKITHYIAVNARTKEVMGSIPVNMKKLVFFSFLVELGAIVVIILYNWFIEFNIFVSIALLFSGFIYLLVMYNKNRNQTKRHKHETDTKKEIRMINQTDDLVRTDYGVSTFSMEDSNHKRIVGDYNANSFSQKITDAFLQAQAENEAKKNKK